MGDSTDNFQGDFTGLTWILGGKADKDRCLLFHYWRGEAGELVLAVDMSQVHDRLIFNGGICRVTWRLVCLTKRKERSNSELPSGAAMRMKGTGAKSGHFVLAAFQ